MNRNKRLVLIAIYVCLAIVLDYIKAFIPFLNMPSGGSINIALIPIVLSSFHLGIASGTICGLLWWLVSSILGLNPYFINIAQYCLDYIVPSVLPGLSAIIYRKRKYIEIELGILFTMLLRTFVLIVSGAVYWPDSYAASSIEAWTASFVYNFPYCLMSTILLLIITPILIKSLKRYML